jgi:hypothetical protein
VSAFVIELDAALDLLVDVHCPPGSNTFPIRATDVDDLKPVDINLIAALIPVVTKAMVWLIATRRASKGMCDLSKKPPKGMRLQVCQQACPSAIIDIFGVCN